MMRISNRTKQILLIFFIFCLTQTRIISSVKQSEITSITRARQKSQFINDENIESSFKVPLGKVKQMKERFDQLSKRGKKNIPIKNPKIQKIKNQLFSGESMSNSKLKKDQRKIVKFQKNQYKQITKNEATKLNKNKQNFVQEQQKTKRSVKQLASLFGKQVQIKNKIQQTKNNKLHVSKDQTKKNNKDVTLTNQKNKNVTLTNQKNKLKTINSYSSSNNRQKIKLNLTKSQNNFQKTKKTNTNIQITSQPILQKQLIKNQLKWKKIDTRSYFTPKQRAPLTMNNNENNKSYFSKQLQPRPNSSIALVTKKDVAAKNMIQKKSTSILKKANSFSNQNHYLAQNKRQKSVSFKQQLQERQPQNIIQATQRQQKIENLQQISTLTTEKQKNQHFKQINSSGVKETSSTKPAYTKTTQSFKNKQKNLPQKHQQSKSDSQQRNKMNKNQNQQRKQKLSSDKKQQQNNSPQNKHQLRQVGTKKQQKDNTQKRNVHSTQQKEQIVHKPLLIESQIKRSVLSQQTQKKNHKVEQKQHQIYQLNIKSSNDLQFKSLEHSTVVIQSEPILLKNSQELVQVRKPRIARSKNKPSHRNASKYHLNTKTKYTPKLNLSQDLQTLEQEIDMRKQQHEIKKIINHYRNTNQIRPHVKEQLQRQDYTEKRQPTFYQQLIRSRKQRHYNTLGHQRPKKSIIQRKNNQLMSKYNTVNLNEDKKKLSQQQLMSHYSTIKQQINQLQLKLSSLQLTCQLSSHQTLIAEDFTRYISCQQRICELYSRLIVEEQKYLRILYLIDRKQEQNRIRIMIKHHQFWWSTAKDAVASAKLRRTLIQKGIPVQRVQSLQSKLKQQKEQSILQRQNYLKYKKSSTSANKILEDGPYIATYQQ